MMNYFKDCKSISELKECYKKLSKMYHPDLNAEDTTSIMQEINSQFEKAFEMLKDRAETADSREPEDSGAAEATAKEFTIIISQLVRCEGLTVDLIGKWIWVGGNTYPYRDLIKKLGFRWANKKRLWYWHKPEDACKSRRDTTIEQIKDKYGVKRYATVATQRLTATV